MGEHTVKLGENLWNICKREFGLKNNSDIANKVNEVAKANGITNPNLIKVGQKITIDFNKSGNEQKTYSEEVTNAVQNKINFNTINTYEDVQRTQNSTVSIFGSNTVKDGKQEQTYNDYSTKLLLDYYDINEDGTVTEEEFAQREQGYNNKLNEITLNKLADDAKAIDGTVTEIPEEELQMYKTTAQRTANLFAQNLDFNDNGKIDAEELAYFTKIADGIDNEYDGVISAANENQMMNAIMGTNCDNQEYKKVIQKYLDGKTLTAEEQKTFEEAQKTIKAALRKASGLNLEC